MCPSNLFVQIKQRNCPEKGWIHAYMKWWWPPWEGVCPYWTQKMHLLHLILHQEVPLGGACGSGAYWSLGAKPDVYFFFIQSWSAFLHLLLGNSLKSGTSVILTATDTLLLSSNVISIFLNTSVLLAMMRINNVTWDKMARSTCSKNWDAGLFSKAGRRKSFKTNHEGVLQRCHEATAFLKY